MRAFATSIVALWLAASPMLARAARPGENDSRAAGEATAASTVATQPASSNATSKADPAPKAETSSAELENELQEVRELLEAQTKQLQEQQQKMEMLEQELRAAKGASESLAAEPAASADPGASPSPAAAIGPVTSALTEGSGRQNQNPEEPLSIRFKGVTLTPGGFFAAETVWREKALASDVNTPFNSVPLPGASQSKMSEFNASGRQSRISMLVEGKLSDVKIGGYYEMDFLSAGTTSNNNQSNSYTMRQRQFFGQTAWDSGLTITGGQMWSLVTETLHGLDNRTEALPQTIDAQYQAGFSWARQFGLRFVKNFDNKLWLGFSVEESQATLTVHGNPTASCAPANPTVAGSVATCSAAALNGVLVTVPTATGTSTAVVNSTTFNNFLLGSFGTSGGLYSPLGNYQFNPAPDIIVKGAWEPGFGHYEVYGVFSDFRDRVFPCVTLSKTLPTCGGLATSAADAYNYSDHGLGLGANGRWSVFNKKVVFGVHALGGNGMGRYGSVGLSDVTTRYSLGDPILDGTLAMILSYQFLGTLELHPMPKLDVNLYVGGEYATRTQYAKTAGALPAEGYGATGFANYGCTTEILPLNAPSTSTSTGVPSGVAGTNGFIPGVLQNCTGDTRNLIEGTLGFWYRFYQGSKGRVQFGGQYSYYVRNTWRGVGTGTASGITYTTNGQPHADESMFFTSLRYYLP
jgi:hypothetical protein